MQMIRDESLYKLFMRDHDAPTRAEAEPIFVGINSLPVPWAGLVDISNAALFLASEDPGCATGLELKVNAG
jgi:hypothetical protein